MGISSGIFRHCKFDFKFHKGVPSRVQNTSIFLNLKRSADLGRSWLGPVGMMRVFSITMESVFDAHFYLYKNFKKWDF